MRKAMGFLNLHFGMLFPIDTAIMKCTRKKRSLHMQGETISVRAMMKIGHAVVHHESQIVRHVCCACYAMGLEDIHLDQPAFLESTAHPGVSNVAQIWIKMAPAAHATSGGWLPWLLVG